MTGNSFRTPSGRGVTAVTADEMREIDRVAVEAMGLQLLQMMENAGRTLAWHVRELRDGDESVIVVAGNGGNGGGGLVCARHLANRAIPVWVILDRRPGELTGVAAEQYRILDEMGVPTAVGAEPIDETGGGQILVDALIGYGLSGTVRPPARTLIDLINRHPGSTVSLDVPSGIDATTGEVLGASVTPRRTVTLALPKTGLESVPGSLFLADIGIPETVYERLDIEYDRPFGNDYWVEIEWE